MYGHILKSRLKSLLHCDFLRREDGTIAIEAMIMLPLFFWAYLGLFSMFDAFHQYSLNQKAAFTIGDAISRETKPIDDDYLDGTFSLFEYLTRSSDQSAIRVSQLYYKAADDTYHKDWSHTRGWVRGLSNADAADMHSRLPVVPDLERIVVVETWNNYEPPFKTGLENTEIKNMVFTRPRYAPRVLWED